MGTGDGQSQDPTTARYSASWRPLMKLENSLENAVDVEQSENEGFDWGKS